jgi:phosphatidylglycerophosphate synthase
MRDMDTAPPMLHALPAVKRRALRFGLAGLAGLGVIQLCRMSGLPGGTASWVAASGGYALIMAAFLMLMQRSYPHLRIGSCNVVTALRAALAFALIAPLLAGEATGPTVALLAMLGMVLDGVDGWLARRTGLVSAFGARFDIEADAILALVLTLHLWAGRDLGPVVLVLGLPYYLFIAAACILPWLSAPLPPAFRRKVICVVQLAALIALQFQQVPAEAAFWAISLASALLLWSFVVDIIWLWRRRT